MKKPLIIIAVSGFMALCSCSKKKESISFYTPDVSFSEEEISPASPSAIIDSETIDIPFRRSNGVKYIAARINGRPFDMIFDTGCSGMLISVSEANYLYQLGLLDESDLGESVLSTIADGSVVEDITVTLKEVILADKVMFENVKAVISQSAAAPILLGNEILDRVYSVTIDNANDLIRLHSL